MKATRTYDIPFALERVKPIIEADTQNKEKEDIMPYITGATLLSASEVKYLNKEILKADNDWWLRSSGDNVSRVACVVGDIGYVCNSGTYATYSFGVRPVLQLENLGSSNYQIGESVYFGGHSFTIISDTYALCDDVIGKCAFCKDSKAENANEYETSDVKKFIDDWFEKAKEQVKDKEKVQDEDEREL